MDHVVLKEKTKLGVYIRDNLASNKKAPVLREPFNAITPYYLDFVDVEVIFNTAPLENTASPALNSANI